MPQCPSCRRPVAMARPTCLYCGAPLPADAVADTRPAPGATPPASPGPRRLLVVVDLAGASEAAVARAFGLSRFEAGQRLRRGGLQLHRAAEEGPAEEEAARLAGDGLAALVVPEDEARTPPLMALGGEPEAGGLRLRTDDGPIRLAGPDLLLVVKGPIARAYQPTLEIRRLQSASLEPGYRIHLHRRADPRPVELDPGNFELGFAVTGSSLLELVGWIDALGPGTRVDDGFRQLPPVLGEAALPGAGPLAAAASLRRPARGGFGTDEAPAILDNLAQFRFYSGWRAAVARRRSS